MFSPAGCVEKGPNTGARLTGPQPKRAAFAIVLAAGCFAHWPALISDSVMWDDWLLVVWITQGRMDWLIQFFTNYGVAPFIFVHLPFVAFIQDANITVRAGKFICFASVLVNASLITAISLNISRGNLLFATLAGTAAACFPGSSGEGFHITFLTYSFFIPLFLAGALMFLIVNTSAGRHIALRIAALFALFFSFSLNSIVVLYYAFIPAVYYASVQRDARSSTVLRSIQRFCFRNLDFIALPFVFWFLKEHLTPRVGIYARYNAFRFDWAGILQGYGNLPTDMLRTILFVPMSISLANWAAAGTVFAVALASQPLFDRLGGRSVSSAHQLFVLLGLGCLAAIGAAFPYYIVGRRSLQTYGFMSRDNVLFPLSVSWIIASLFCLLLLIARPLAGATVTSAHGFLRRLVLAAFCAMMVAQSLLNWRNHADWQAHYAYYRSVVHKMAQDEGLARASVIEIVDTLPGDRSLQRWTYPTSIWTAIVSAAFKETRRLAIPFKPENGRLFARAEIERRVRDTEVAFMLGEIDLRGQQVRLVVAPGEGARNSIRLALAYWYTRYFAPERMSALLGSLTELRTSKLSGE